MGLGLLLSDAEVTGVAVTRVRLSGSVVPGVGMLEYYHTNEEALGRRADVLLDAPGANLSVEEVQCYLDEDGEVLAELEG